MPIYEYNCRDCGRDFELLLRGREDRPVCRDCGGTRLERRLSAFATPGGNPGAEPDPGLPCGSCGAPSQGMCDLD